jgi:hypothetical protein
VQKASIVNEAPGGFSLAYVGKPRDLSSQAKANSKKQLTFKAAAIDYGYLPTLGIKLLAGRDFFPHIPFRTGKFISNKKE